MTTDHCDCTDQCDHADNNYCNVTTLIILLTQVKELGLLGTNCECLAQDAQRLFDVYWYLSTPGTTIPSKWPPQFGALFSMDSPAKLDIGANQGTAFWSVSCA